MAASAPTNAPNLNAASHAADHIVRQRPAEPVPTCTDGGAAAAAHEAVHKAAAIESGASADQQREGGNAAAAKAAQPPIEVVPSFLNEATVERAGASRIGSQRAGEPTGTLRRQMIDFQRAVLASPGIGWRVPARRWSIGGLNRRLGGAQARIGGPLAAWGGLGGRTLAPDGAEAAGGPGMTPPTRPGDRATRDLPTPRSRRHIIEAWSVPPRSYAVALAGLPPSLPQGR